ncbi:MAG: hypothetical protein QXL89_03745 [Nitrososphaeria archaeon]
MWHRRGDDEDARCVLGNSGGNLFEVLEPADAIFCPLFSLRGNSASCGSVHFNQDVG